MTDHRDPIEERIDAALRSVEPEDLAPAAPPAGLWDQIAEATAQPPDPPVALALRPRRVWPMALAAAAAAVLLVGSATAFVATQQDADRELIVASADVSSDGLPDAVNASGVASVIDGGSGRVLDLSASLPPASDGTVFEVWLIDDKGDLQSLGLTDGASRHAIPAGVDLDRFTIVDVSREAVGGDPGHSKDSVVRGQLV